MHLRTRLLLTGKLIPLRLNLAGLRELPNVSFGLDDDQALHHPPLPTLFPVRRFCKVIYCIVAYIIAWQLFQTFDTIFVCKPVSGYWDRNIHAKCRNQLVDIIVGGVQNIVTDVTILGLPLPILWNLHMSKRRKMQLTGLFALGGLYVSSYR